MACAPLPLHTLARPAAALTLPRATREYRMAMTSQPWKPPSSSDSRGSSDGETSSSSLQLLLTRNAYALPPAALSRRGLPPAQRQEGRPLKESVFGYQVTSRSKGRAYSAVDEAQMPFSERAKSSNTKLPERFTCAGSRSGAETLCASASGFRKKSSNDETWRQSAPPFHAFILCLSWTGGLGRGPCVEPPPAPGMPICCFTSLPSQPQQ